ncbi:uncharacterized protein LOC128202453 [Galleria mellonella]|uniref:Uncharacterized protein LOC128202453 n=1 Tax=Galleria mellonella TaxID=7137 RepID=A0ABM3N5S0_GALME|nr:uncharacterized protein LOC128202453 [Galleria mellonella]
MNMDEPSTSSSNDTEEKFCEICLLNTSERLVLVTSKGKVGLKAASNERRDKLFSNMDNSKTVYVHHTCRSNYVHKGNIAASAKRAAVKNSVSPTKKKLRRSGTSSSVGSASDVSATLFDWDKNCFICDNEINTLQEKKKASAMKKKTSKVQSLDFIQNLAKMLIIFKDDERREILKRIHSAENHVILTEGKYHEDCVLKLKNEYKLFTRSSQTPYFDKISEAMEEIYDFMLSSEECQFTMTQLIEAVQICDVIPHEDTIKNHLKKRFGNQIVISSRIGGVTYVCFSTTLYDILTDSWRKQKSKTIEEEENALIDSAAELIRRKIRTVICDVNQYSPSDKILINVNESIPPQLLRFLEHIIYKDKHHNEQNFNWYSKKITSIAHAIMSSARPKSFISPLQLATGATLYRKFGSKKMIELCYNLGFSCSYAEVQLYEISAACQDERLLKEPFLQIVSDNSDFNVCTIDGRGTFHNLGSIEIITPAECLQARKPIKRLRSSEVPLESELVEKNRIDIQLYTKKTGSGLGIIKVQKISPEPKFTITIIDVLNVLWSYFKYARDLDFLGWNGFMSMLCAENTNYKVSKINFLPFINGPPSDYNTLFTALNNAAAIVSKEGMKTCIVTFDQPLYIKACDIAETLVFDDVLIVVRLGGFHLLMSFMGCIGTIMEGSGIKEIFSLIFAEGSVDQILNGHSYARAVRAHFILPQALSLLIFDELKRENNVEFQELLDNEEYFTYEMNFEKLKSNEHLKKLNEIFQSKLDEIENRGKTCKLWILYYKMVSLLKKFLAAERMGDWEAHLNCIELMIPFFHAAGHFNYAKSARLYLQKMRLLKLIMDPREFKKFTKEGFFTSRRSNEFYAGIFSDQTIEQTLMRAMSVEGGPFKRGTTESTVFKWIKGIIYTNDVIEALEKFCDIAFNKSYQHVDARDARIKKDKKDVLVLKTFLLEHNPFEDIDHLKNIVTGLIGTDEINCYNALAIGIEAMKSIDDITFNDIKLSKKDKVISLIGVNSKVKIDDKIVPIDPLLLFQRICIMKKSNEELEMYLKYELAPYPLSLFDDIGMRKTNKSILYSLFETQDIVINKEASVYFIDGGMLLYRVKWPSKCNYADVFDSYISYLKNHFGNNITVVFDCYDRESNKASERNRRALKVASKEYQFTKDMPANISQDKFLSNYKNKRRFIKFLMEELEKKSIKCCQGEGEADELIVDTAVSFSTDLTKIIVAEDVDILVILTARATEDEEILFLKLGKQRVQTVIYLSKSLEIKYPNSSKFILFAHSFTGCDSTSAAYNKGKKIFMDLLERRQDLRSKAEIFLNNTSELEDILEAGRYCMVCFYGLAKDAQQNKLSRVESLSEYLEKMRYESFLKAATKNTAVKLSSLVPTVGAINEHTKRVYLQTQIWLGNKNIHPTDWGGS